MQNYYPPQGYPHQQPGYPPQQQQQGYPPPQQQQPGYPPQQPSYPAQQIPLPTSGLPQLYMPDDAEVARAYEEAKAAQARAGTGGQQYVKFLGPQGETKWSSVPVGYESLVTVWICPSWEQGSPLLVQSMAHFWQSQMYPKGHSLVCVGDGCQVCAAAEYTKQVGDDSQKAKAKSYGRGKSKYLYNVILLGDPRVHLGQDGQMRPFILDSSPTLHLAINEIFSMHGSVAKVIDPTHGRPIRLKKRKTGPKEMNVEYSALAFDPSPLPAEYFPIYNNLYNLQEIRKSPTQEEQVRAAMDIGLLLPGMPAQTAAHQPQALYQPPTGSPYGQPMMPPPPAPMGQFQPPRQTPGVPQAQPQTQSPPPPAVTPPPVCTPAMQPQQQYAMQPSAPQVGQPGVSGQAASPPPPPPPPPPPVVVPPDPAQQQLMDAIKGQ